MKIFNMKNIFLIKIVKIHKQIWALFLIKTSLNNNINYVKKVDKLTMILSSILISKSDSKY